MQKLTRDSLFSLEEYSETREKFRAEVMRHKRDRRLPLGTNATLYFEDRLTMQYQVQEMLRIERIFEASGIDEELEAYNPLIPDGSNWKATFMIEFPDPGERPSAKLPAFWGPKSDATAGPQSGSPLPPTPSGSDAGGAHGSGLPFHPNPRSGNDGPVYSRSCG